MNTNLNTSLTPTKFPYFAPKGWGWERWIVNKPEYCLKEMFLAKGKKCSLHYHIKKDETFYVVEGEMCLKIYALNNEGIEKGKREFSLGFYMTTIRKGEFIHIPRNCPHFFYGTQDCYFFEVSTQHFEEDSCRIIKGD